MKKNNSMKVENCKAYTWGYQGRQPVDLENIIREKKITRIIDVRSRPYGRAYKFNRKKLEEFYPQLYIWRGDSLGGFGEITETSIAILARELKILSGPGLLMCYEKNPLECHRHYEISRRLKKYGVETINL